MQSEKHPEKSEKFQAQIEKIQVEMKRLVAELNEFRTMNPAKIVNAFVVFRSMEGAQRCIRAYYKENACKTWFKRVVLR